MKKTFLFSVIFCSFIFDSIASLSQEINSLSSNDYTELRFLDEAIRGKDIVFLGESQHGVNDFNILKFRLIRYLHEVHGFDVVVFESGIGSCGLTNEIKDSLTGMEMLVYSLMGVWRVKGNCELMDYIRTNGMQIAGVDPNNGAIPFNKKKYQTLLADEKFAEDFARTDSVMLYKFIIPRDAWYHRNIETSIPKLDSIARSLKVEYNRLLTKVSQSTLSDQRKRIIAKAIESKLLTLSCSNNKSAANFYIGMERRDTVMASNMVYMVDSLYQNKKIIVWAHNGHIQKQDPVLGGILPQRIKDRSFVLGLTAIRGEIGMGFQKPFQLKPPNGSIEKVYASMKSKAFFLDTDLIQEKKYYYNANIHEKKDISKYFDGLILVNDVEPSQLLKYSKDFRCE